MVKRTSQCLSVTLQGHHQPQRRRAYPAARFSPEPLMVRMGWAGLQATRRLRDPRVGARTLKMSTDWRHGRTGPSKTAVGMEPGSKWLTKIELELSADTQMPGVRQQTDMN